jgi:hypothetical protein
MDTIAERAEEILDRIARNRCNLGRFGPQAATPDSVSTASNSAESLAHGAL